MKWETERRASGVTKQKMEIDMTIGVICILFCLSVPDLIKQRIPLWMIGTSCVVAVGLRTVLFFLEKTNITVAGFVAAFLPGCLLLLLAFVTREQIGYGDGMVLFIIGILYPVWRVMIVAGIALLSISIMGIFLLVIKKGNRNTRLPFVPFLFWGSLIENGLRIMENG